LTRRHLSKNIHCLKEIRVIRNNLGDPGAAEQAYFGKQWEGTFTPRLPRFSEMVWTRDLVFVRRRKAPLQ